MNRKIIKALMVLVKTLTILTNIMCIFFIINCKNTNQLYTVFGCEISYKSFVILLAVNYNFFSLAVYMFLKKVKFYFKEEK